MNPIAKRLLSEREICTKFITPAVKCVGWDEMLQVREEVGFTKGRIIVRGNLVTRCKAKRADYVLYYKPNIPIALIEAKDNNYSVADGIQQGLEYATTLDIPFVFSSNVDGFVFHDCTGISAEKETNLALEEFPSLGQISNYIGWVQDRIADGEPVVGLVISRGSDTKFQSSIRTTDRISQVDIDQIDFS